MMKLSIIVPVYNVEKYLRRCIDSVLSQSFKDFELILIDDGSTDNSSKICDEYYNLDKRVKVIHKKNGGLSSARNIGLDIAQGEYIGFVDSDDYIALNMFEVMINLAVENKCDIISCGYKRFYNEICNNSTCKGITYKYTNVEALSNYLLDYNDINRKMDTVVWNKIYKKELFDNIRFPENKIYEDGYVTYKLLYKSNNLIHIDDELYYYFQREGSISNSGFTEKDVKSYDDWRDIFRFIFININYLSNLAANKYIKKNINIYIKICQCKDKINNSKEYKKKIKDDLMEDYKNLLKLDIDKELNLELRLFKLDYRLVIILRRIKQGIIYIKKSIKGKYWSNYR